MYTALVADGFPTGYAADDGAALHFVGTELREVVASRPGLAYRASSRAWRRPSSHDACEGKVAILSSASGNGKTTVGRALAASLGVPFHELDALHHGPNWTEATRDELRAKVEPIVVSDAWVIDGAYRGKIGDLVLEAADTVVWLDLPMRVWLPRLLRRTPRASSAARSSGTATASD